MARRFAGVQQEQRVPLHHQPPPTPSASEPGDLGFQQCQVLRQCGTGLAAEGCSQGVRRRHHPPGRPSCHGAGGGAAFCWGTQKPSPHDVLHTPLTNQQSQEFGADQWLGGGAVTGRAGAGGGGCDCRRGREGSLRGRQSPALSCDPAPWSCKVLLAGERRGGAHGGPGACPPALVLETVWESTLSQNLPKKEARPGVSFANMWPQASTPVKMGPVEAGHPHTDTLCQLFR